VNLTYLPKDTSILEAVTHLTEHGALVIENVIDGDTVNVLRGEIAQYIENTPMGRDKFSGYKTQRTGGLVSRSAICRSLVTNDLILGITEKYLEQFTRKIILHLTQAITIHPGGEAQVLHRDREAWGDYLPLEIEPQLNTIWALTDFTRENGATRCVPGSHKWDWSQRANPEQITESEMSLGSVFIYNGSVLHSGGANHSSSPRIGLNLTYCLGWLRQEENQYLSCPPDIAKNFDPTLQALLGYTQGEYALGYYSDPYSESGGAIRRPEKALE
jgi:ectoine hydroxylase-related dioxygenase (phytanoyl-CoA dioxygenase family)